jgi:drug/metabolite transporter (DMT)-like permease
VAEFSSFPRAWYALSIGTITAFSLWLLCAGLGHASALSGSAIVGAEPVVAAILSWVVLEEVLSSVQILGAMGVVAGVTMLSVHTVSARASPGRGATGRSPRPRQG